MAAIINCSAEIVIYFALENIFITEYILNYNLSSKIKHGNFVVTNCLQVVIRFSIFM